MKAQKAISMMITRSFLLVDAGTVASLFGGCQYFRLALGGLSYV